jgi:hypothetical protein
MNLMFSPPLPVIYVFYDWFTSMFDGVILLSAFHTIRNATASILIDWSALIDFLGPVHDESLDNGELSAGCQLLCDNKSETMLTDDPPPLIFSYLERSRGLIQHWSHSVLGVVCAHRVMIQGRQTGQGVTILMSIVRLY